MNPRALVTDQEAVGEFTLTNRLSAWIQKHDIVRHQGKQPRKIARIDRINPGGMYLAYRSFITSLGGHPKPANEGHLKTGQ
jgi:hypothetical protein